MEATPILIVNSKLLRRVLFDLRLDEYSDDHEILMQVKSNLLLFPNNCSRQICVDIKGDFGRYLTVKQLQRLYRLVSIIEEQPLAFQIDSAKWINIKGFVI